MSLNDLFIKAAANLPEEEKIAAIERNKERKPATAAQAQRDLISRGLGKEEIDGIKYEEDDEYARAFGQDQTDLNTYGDDEREAVERLLSRRREDLLDLRERSNRLEKQGKKLSAGEKATINELIELLGVDDADPQVRPDIAPKSVLRDAVTMLEQAGQYGFDAFPGAAQALGRLEDDIRPNREAESALVRELKARDDKRFSERRRQYNVVKNRIEADQISRDRYVGTGPAAFGEENLGRIGEVRSMGAAGSLGPMEMSQVIRFGDRARMLDAEPIIDAAGKVVGYADPKTKVPIALDPAAEISAATQGANTPNTAQALNAPASPQTAQQWAASNLPEMVQDGGSTPPRYPQANITRETTEFADRLRGLGQRIESPALSGVSGNIRSLDELQKTADLVSREVSRRGGRLSVLDPRTGENIPAGSQTVSGVMNKLGMSSGDEQRLANALFQLDAARRSSVNQNATGTYLARQTPPRPAEASDITFDAPSEGFGSIRIAQIKDKSKQSRFRKGKIDGKRISEAASKPYEARPADGPSSPLSSFLQDQVYNKTRETSDDAIRAVLEDRASKRKAPKNESPADKAIRLARDESNIKAAQSVQRRAVEDAVRRSQIDAVRRQYMPPFMRR